MLRFPRWTIRQPGYDCMRSPCGKKGCGTNPGASHGICSELWWFTVSDKERRFALTLFVITQDRYPESVPSSVKRSTEYLAEMHTHIRCEDGNGDECEYLGKCASDVGATWGRDFWDRWGTVSGFDQSELFWFELENALKTFIAQKAGS